MEYETLENYQIIRTSNPKELETAVRKKMQIGWEPVGGATLTVVSGKGEVWIQAMLLISSLDK